MHDSNPPPQEARTWTEGSDRHIDVRGLSAPAPLVQILRLVASVPAGCAVIAHLDRDPMMLYPELATVGWAAEHIDGDPGEVRLRLEPIG